MKSQSSSNKSAFKQLANLEKELRGKKDELSLYKITLLEEVKSFLLGGSYTSYDKKEDFLKNVFNETYVIAHNLDIKQSSVQKVKERISTAFFEVVGKDIFLRIKDANDYNSISEIYTGFLCLSKGYRLKDLIPFEFTDTIRKSKLDNEVFNIDECWREMALLHWMTIKKFQKLCGDVNLDKLNYLLDLLSGDVVDISSKEKLLMSLLCNDINTLAKDHLSEVQFPPKQLSSIASNYNS